MANEAFEYEELANGIVLQAHEDYLEALLMEHKAILMLARAAKRKQSVLSFYGTKWYYSLTKTDPAVLLDTARKQADYIIWQKNHRCDKCEIDSCPHRVERVNWKMWADGRKVCLNDGNRKQPKSD